MSKTNDKSNLSVIQYQSIGIHSSKQHISNIHTVSPTDGGAFSPPPHLSLGIFCSVYKLIHPCFPLTIVCLTPVSAQAFNLTVIPTSSIENCHTKEKPDSHSGTYYSLILITRCVLPEPAQADPAQVQVRPYGGTQLVLSPS